MIVVDVNVVAYLLIEGEHTAESEALLLADREWAAPLLWRSEWRNILAGYLRRGVLDRTSAEQGLRGAARLVEGREYLPDGGHVLDLVAVSGCSAYDCEYVAVAQTLGAPLLTYDRAVLADFPEVATSPAEFLAS